MKRGRSKKQNKSTPLSWRRNRMPFVLAVVGVGLRVHAAPHLRSGGREAADVAERGAGLAKAPWPKFHGDVRSTGVGGGQAAGISNPWKTPLLTSNASGPLALGADGTVFVAGKNLAALNGANGKVKWNFPDADINIAGAVIDAGNTVYICGAAGHFGSGKNNVYALDASTGKVRWTFPMRHNATNSPALGANGLLYVQCSDGDLFALDTRTGRQKWIFAMPESIFTSPQAFHTILPAVMCSPSIGADGTIYTSHDRLYAIDGETGKQKWVATGPNAPLGVSPAIGQDGTLYVGMGKQSDGKNNGGVVALDAATGRRRWTFVTPGYTFDTPPALDTDGTLYVGSYDSGMYALNSADGTLKWHFAAPGTIGAAPAISAGHILYFGCGDGKFYALDGATGKTKWATALESVPILSPALGANGLVYTTTRDGIIYALRASDGAKPRPVAAQ